VKVRRSFAEPRFSASFPTSALTVTDDFHRPDEIPIGPPWQTGLEWFQNEAAIISNQYVSQDRTTLWDGGANYPGPWDNFEAIARLGTDISTFDGTAFVELGTGIVSAFHIMGVYLQPFSVVMKAHQRPDYPSAIVASIGDQIGMRVGGSVMSMWYCPVATGAWEKRAEDAMSDHHADVLSLYTYADGATRGPIGVSEFRIAEIGDLIPARGRITARRTAW